MAKVLVTGFEPFGGETINPAWEAVSRLPAQIVGAEVVRECIPVSFARAPQAVGAAIEREDPDIVLCVGQAGGRTAMTPELVGVNWAEAFSPDNDGEQPAGRRIVSAGPDAHLSTLPAYDMVAAMKEAGVPAQVSTTAGTYVCNCVLYSLLHFLAEKRPEVRGGFLHVPYAPEQAAIQRDPKPSMSVDLMVRGLTVALETALQA